MYLREMGSVELLSREGEIAIAKRIEAGRNLMINGLCESPLTFQAISIWRNELLNEEIMLRDVIDLETTFNDTGESEVFDPEIKRLDTSEASNKPSPSENKKENDFLHLYQQNIKESRTLRHWNICIENTFYIFTSQIN